MIMMMMEAKIGEVVVRHLTFTFPPLNNRSAVSADLVAAAVAVVERAGGYAGAGAALASVTTHDCGLGKEWR